MAFRVQTAVGHLAAYLLDSTLQEEYILMLKKPPHIKLYFILILKLTLELY